VLQLFLLAKEVKMIQPPHPIDSTLAAVGNTPLVKLQKVVPADCADIYVKLEYYNPTGSYKDRMALAMIEEAEKRGDLRPGMTVVEYTGGSTGSSLAFICAVKGYPFKVVSSDAFASEKLRTMQAFGAELTIEPSEGGKITPDLIPRMMATAKTIAKSIDFNPRTLEHLYPELTPGYVVILRLASQQGGEMFRRFGR
jgi:cysteine synthase A